ncbi:MAG: BatA domain-containing protein [Bacteroidia bacterium]
MNFLYPTFLFALSALIIPIIVHLFNFRKFKKLYFPNVRFLKEVKEETQSKSRLKHLLILAARILAITSLVLAFAQPYIPVSETQALKGIQHIGIYIDNSFSMANLNENGRLLDDARNKAKEIIKAYSPNDKFLLTTNDFEGRHQRLASRDEALEWIDEIKESPIHRKLDEIINRQKDVLQTHKESLPKTYILSDFQQNFVNSETLIIDTVIQICFVPITALNNNNLYIDSVAFSTPYRQLNQPEELWVRIVNKGDKKADNASLKLFINGEQKAIAAANIEPNSSEMIKLGFTVSKAGWQQAQIKLTDYPITYDDDLYFSFNVAERINVLCINGEKESPYINKLFKDDIFFNFINNSEKQINYAEFPSYSFIILNEINSISSGLAQELQRFIKNGGSVFLIPAKNADWISYNNFTQLLNACTYQAIDTSNNKTTRINVSHQLYANVFEKIPENIDLPITLSHYPLNYTSKTNYDWLMMLANNRPLVSSHSYQKGKLYLSAVSLDVSFGNFARHAMFVPSVYKMALYSVSNPPLFYTIGKDDVVEFSSINNQNDNILTLKEEKSKTDLIPESRWEQGNVKMYLYNQIQNAGNYNLYSGNEHAASIAFNFDRNESELEFYDKTALEQLIDKYGWTNTTVIEATNGNLTQTIQNINKGIQLWKLFIVLTLVFLAIEVLLIKFYK